MKRRLIAAAAALFLCAAQAPPLPNVPTDLPAAVTEDEIAVTSDYRGFSITVFGVNPDRRGQGDVVVAVRGPPERASLMRKRRVFGIWVNSARVEFAAAPAFFTVISAKPLRQIASPQAIWSLQLDPAAAARLAGPTPGDADPSEYREALVRLRERAGLYSEDARGLTMLSRNRLFRAQIRIPANAPIGAYVADVYLFRGGRLVSSQRSTVNVSRAGFERTVHSLATERPFIYGMLTLALALSAGWGASLIFRRK